MISIHRAAFLLTLIFISETPVNPQVRRNTEPLNIGFIFSLPYDISNTLRAPLGGPLSLILGAGLALIMFFGMLATPVYYIWGLPPRRYHIRDAEMNFTLDADFLSRSLDSSVDTNWINNETTEEVEIRESPNFLDSAFLLIPVEETECRLLMVCHAHGFLRWIPREFIQFYKFFSRKITEINEKYSEAVIIGFEDQDQCAKVFKKCSLDIVTIGKMTFNNIITHILN